MKASTFPATAAPAASDRGNDDARRACRWLAATLALLPLLQACPVDVDRIAPLALLPAIILGFGPLMRPGAKAERADTLLLAFAGLVSMFGLAINPHAAAPLIVTTASWVFVIVGGALAARVAIDARGKRLLFAGIAAAGVLGMGMVLWRGVPAHDIFPYYSHPRIFGMAMMTAAMASLALLVVEPPRSRALHLVNLIVACVAWTAFLWSGSRGPLAGMAVALAAWWFFAPREERHRLCLWLPVLAVIGMLASLSLGAPNSALGWWTAFERTPISDFTNAAELTSNRTAIWSVVWRVIQDSPWIGHGQDAYRYITPRQDGDQPHDFLLQWLLEFGFVGATALVAVLARRVWRGLRAKVDAFANGKLDASAENENVAWRRAAAACLLCSAGAGLFDGVFYHAVVFIPTAIFAGIAGVVAVPQVGAFARRANAVFMRVLLVVCAGLLLLHGWLYYHLVAPPPASPAVLPARVLRVFPSSTMGLWRWLDKWNESSPAVAIDWALWAEPRSFTPAVYYDCAARYYLGLGDLKEADRQFVGAVATTHISAKQHFEDLLTMTREVEAGRPPVWPAHTPAELLRQKAAAHDNPR